MDVKVAADARVAAAAFRVAVGTSCAKARAVAVWPVEYLELENNVLKRPLIKGLFPSVSPSNKWVSFEAGDQIGISRIDGLMGRSLVKGRTPFWTN